MNTITTSNNQNTWLSFYLILGSIVPTGYILLLPWLSEKGFAYDMEDDDHQITISRYISNVRGTGAMGAVFFFPLMMMWEAPIHASRDVWMRSYAFYSLLGF